MAAWMLRAATASPMRNSWKAPCGVAHQRLRPALDEGAVVDRAEVGRRRLQLEVEVGVRRGAVIDHDLVDVAGRTVRAVVAADLDAEPTVSAAHGEHPLVEGDPGVGLVERPGVRDVVHAADLDAEHALGRDDLERRAGTGDHLGRRQRRVGAVVVEEQHVAARA